jgi:hypothetical protein
MNRPVTKAAAILANGPLTETSTVSLLILLKYLKSTGTGLAHPKLNRKRQMAPKGSIWLMGLSESLPALLAVGSPRKRAILPWAYSWMVMAKRRTGILIIHSAILMGTYPTSIR